MEIRNPREPHLCNCEFSANANPEVFQSCNLQRIRCHRAICQGPRSSNRKRQGLPGGEQGLVVSLCHFRLIPTMNGAALLPGSSGFAGTPYLAVQDSSPVSSFMRL